MNSKQNSQKDINEYKIVVPMSNETANKIKSNITKSILGVSIAGVMITGAATQAKAEAIENPTAIVQEVKEEERARYKEELAAIVEGLLSKGNEATTLANRDKTSLSTGEEDVLDNQIQSLSVNREEASGDQELSAQSLEDSVEISSVENPASIFAANRPSASEESDAEIETSSAKAEEEALTEILSAGQGQEADLASAKTDDEAQSNKAKTEDATEESLSEDQVQKDQVEKEANAEEAKAKAEVEETPAAKAEEKAEENSDVETGNSEAEVPDQEEPKNEETIEENNSTSLDALKNTEALGNLFDAEKIKTDAVKNLGAEDKIEVGEEKTPEAQKAPGEENEPNYAEDEAKIKDFNESERYRSTQMEQGNGTAADFTPPDEMDKFIDGYRYHSSEPSATSEDKTKWGVEIEIDKEKGQRTYTDFYFTNGANLGDVLETGNVSANEAGDTITGGNKNPNYKATSEIEITGSRAQRNLNLYASEEDLKHINNQDNTNTTMAWQGKYLKDHPNGLKATEGTSAAFGFTVNPWPNENDKLDLIKLNGSHNQKEFVQGQTITTNVQVENLDDSARERLVGQVYHPITGEVVPGAKAYINDEGKVVVEMPKGTINEDGSINEDSIFYKDTKYKGIQNLEVKFFARPRTADEFKAIVEGNQAGFYTGTGAGTATINHNGKDVVIDKQGIDRYDHYNLIGGFKLNLDDTRYYDQGFIDENNEDTSKHTSSKVKPGEELDVNLYVPEDKKDKDVFPNQKTPEEMEAAKDANQAVGTIDWQFINKINEGKKPEDQWKLDYDESTLPTKFKITPPESAKAGDFVAVPLTYTYTNGSTDVHWFHFVVQESTNDRPEYSAQVAFPSEEQKSPAELTKDTKKLSPTGFYIPEGTEFKDDHGNEWNVSIDEETGEVIAKPVDPSKFDGGEKINVPVIAKYFDPKEPDKVIIEKTKAEFVIKERANMTPRYNAKAGTSGDVLSSDVILNSDDKYNRKPSKYTLASDTYIDDKGNTWNVTIDEKTGQVKATVPEGEEGKSIDGALLNVPVTAHYSEVGSDKVLGTREVEVQFVSYGTNGTFEKKEEIPFETKVEKDPNLKKGEIKVITEGKKGSKKVTYTIKDSKVDEEKTLEKILEEPQERLIHVGEGVNDGTHEITEKVTVPFETIVEFDDSLAPGEQKVTQEGEAGEKTRKTTLTIEDGKVTKTEEGEFEQNKAPVNKIIKVGRNTEGEVVHKEEIPFKYTVEYDPSLKAGEYKVETPGRNGERITTWTIKNSKADGDPKVVETQPIDAVIKVGNKDFTGEFKTTKKEAVEFETEYIVDNSIEPGTTKVEQEGELGEKETLVTHTITNGQVTKSEEGETKQTKAPVKRIVKVGPAKTDGTHTYTSKKPFEVEVRVNPELKKGEHKVVQKGVEGEEEYTITIENSKVTNTSEPKETKAPVNEIIEVGSEDFTGTHETKKTKAVEFETEYVVDNSMEPGTTKVEQEGELGEEETTVTHTIVNGQVTKSEEGKPVQTKAPVKRIVKVGPAKTDGTHTYTNKKPFEVEVRVNPELKKGEHKVVQKGVEGEEEYTITIENSKVTNTSEPKETKAPVKEIIEVGSEDYTGTVEYVDKDPVPYETEVTVDPSLKPGEIVEDQKGELGEQETKITRTITNGE
ncbi:G5 domain-containing protein, partial [uncultured Ezakiella sp.]|uniref:G5 domain-containing protein n=1 Tax=uncultured Ezakiella sp. TaxID=1637529 RepID=UPI0025F04ADB